MSQQVFLARFELVVARFGPALIKSQNALKMGYFSSQNGSKMDQKCVFPKMILDHLGRLNN